MLDERSESYGSALIIAYSIRERDEYKMLTRTRIRSEQSHAIADGDWRRRVDGRIQTKLPGKAPPDIAQDLWILRL